MKKLKDLLDEHPEWLNLPVAIYCSDGHLDFVGDAGLAYVSEWWDDELTTKDDYDERGEYTGERIKVLVFSSN